MMPNPNIASRLIRFRNHCKLFCITKSGIGICEVFIHFIQVGVIPAAGGCVLEIHERPRPSGAFVQLGLFGT